MLNYYLHRLSSPDSGTFPIKIDEFVGEVFDPRDILTHFLKRVYDNVSQYNKLSEELKKQAGRLMAKEFSYSSGERASIAGSIKAWINAIPAILGVSSEISSKLEEYTETVLRQSSDIEDLIVFVNQLIEQLQRDARIRHVVMFIDETDKITEPGSVKISPERAASFFQKVVPVLSKTTCSYVFVMNAQYDTPGFRQEVLQATFDRTVTIPRVESKAGIHAVVEKRTRAACGNIDLDSVWDANALDELFELYKARSLRDVIMVCKIAVEKARNETSEKVGISHVNEAIKEHLLR